MERYRYIPPVLIVCAILAVVGVRAMRPTFHHVSDSAIMMGTFVEVSVWAEDEDLAGRAVEAAMREIAWIDSMFGDGTLDSATGAAIMGSEEFGYMIEVARQAQDMTGGMFDPTVGAVSRLWEYHDTAVPPSADSIHAALERVGLERYLAGKACPGRVFDLGGIAKGYAVDLAAQKIVAMGVKSAIINAGGDLRLIGSRVDGRPWRIAIRHPRRTGSFLGYLDIRDAAVATSGDYEKYFIYEGRRYHHILDPRTGMPGGASNSVTVVAPNSCLSDALATGLFLLGPDRGLRVVEGIDSVEAVFAYASGESVAVSSGLEENLVRLDAE